MQGAAGTRSRSTQPHLGERWGEGKWSGKASRKKASWTWNMKSGQVEEVGSMFLAQRAAHGRPGGGEDAWKVHGVQESE